MEEIGEKFNFLMFLKETYIIMIMIMTNNDCYKTFTRTIIHCFHNNLNHIDE